MLDVVFAQVKQVSKEWKSEVKNRRKISSTDPIADTIAYCAEELDSAVKKMEQDTEQLTPAQYAKLHKTTPQTVTLWIRSGKVRATPNGRGWLIARNTPAPSNRRGSKKKEEKLSS